MNIAELMNGEMIDFTGIPSNYFLLGLLSAFENRFQAMADRTMDDVSWKQFFAIICINMCKDAPTINELSEILGSSHQNVKQILLKLEKKNLVRFEADDSDRRKQRIVLTDECRQFCEANDEKSMKIMEKMFTGVSEKEIATTIKTIMKIENNLKEIG